MAPTKAQTAHHKMLNNTATQSPKVHSAYSTVETATASQSSQTCSKASKASKNQPHTGIKTEAWVKRRRQTMQTRRQFKSKIKIKRRKKSIRRIRARIFWVDYKICWWRKMTNWIIMIIARWTRGVTKRSSISSTQANIMERTIQIPASRLTLLVLWDIVTPTKQDRVDIRQIRSKVTQGNQECLEARALERVAKAKVRAMKGQKIDHSHIRWTSATKKASHLVYHQM